VHKSKIILVISGTLIAAGLVLSAIGEQVILEGISQEREKISLEKTLSISSNFDTQETPIGIFNVQIMDFKDNTFSVKVLDPFEIEIISQEIEKESFENKFDVFETGTYKLIIKSTSSEENLVVGSIGPLPDNNKIFLRYISMFLLLGGLIGLVGSGIYVVKNRRGSV
jgi:hypothetical protein